MPMVLHVLTQPADELVQRMMDAQSSQPGCALEVFDLTQPQPDYGLLVDRIFEADSVAVW